MRIRAHDPSSASDSDAAFDLIVAAGRADDPGSPDMCRRNFDGQLTAPWPGSRPRRWLAEDGGRIVGVLKLGFNELDNQDNVEIELTVRPDHRRRGIGTELLRLAKEQVRAAGARRLMAETLRPLPDAAGPSAGSLFAATTGAKLAQTEVRRRLDLSTVDLEATRAKADELAAAAAGYSVHSWTDVAPDEFVAGIALLNGRFFSEAPMGDLAWEPQKVDAARVRAEEAVRETRGFRQYDTVVRHDATGEVVGWTALARGHCADWHLWQNVTLVLPEHRGHRLGLLAKLVNLVRVTRAEPAATRVDTWNAAGNTHMIAINEAMGFRPLDCSEAWQLEVL